MSDSETLRIGIIGLDSSWGVSLAAYCSANPSVGATVAAAWAGGSVDAPLSVGRLAEFADVLQTRHGVKILSTPEEVAEQCDALAMLSMDGRTRPTLFERLAPFQKPIFIAKPLAMRAELARVLVACAARNQVRWFSASAARFAAPALSMADSALVECPLWFEPANAGWFWYGIHGVELIQAVMGAGVSTVRVTRAETAEELELAWQDGRRGRVIGRLNREAPYQLGINGRPASEIEVSLQPLEERMVRFFRGADAPVGVGAMLEIVALVEAVNRAREAPGSIVTL